MQKMIDSGYAVQVPRNEVKTFSHSQYIPHQPIINGKKPDKVRVVYDCAATAYNRSSNDFLIKKKKARPGKFSNWVLLRFQRKQISITADIEAKFYLITKWY